MAYRLNKDDLAYRKVGDEFFVLTLADKTLHNVRGVGVRIMELLDEGKGEDAILATVLAEYEVSREEAAADLAAFLQELATKGIISRDGD